MAQINEVDIPRWARYWVKPLTPSQVLLRYSDTTVSELQLRIRTPVVSGFSYGSEMHVCTLTHSGLLHASGLSAVSWLTAWVDLEIQVRAYLSTIAVLRAY